MVSSESVDSCKSTHNRKVRPKVAFTHFGVRHANRVRWMASSMLRGVLSVNQRDGLTYCPVLSSPPVLMQLQPSDLQIS